LLYHDRASLFLLFFSSFSFLPFEEVNATAAAPTNNNNNKRPARLESKGSRSDDGLVGRRTQGLLSLLQKSICTFS
jgi:hypothetical protein